VGPSAKLKLFVEMFKTIFGDETYASDLEEVLMKKKLLSQHMLVQERTILRVQAACKVVWEAKYDADSAETATDAIEATRERFQKAHDHGGPYYTAIPSLGITSVGMGAVGGSTSSGTAMVIGAGTGTTVPTPMSGSIGKTTASQTRDRDNEIFLSNKPADAGQFVIEHQHLLRTMLRVRVPIVLGPDTDFTVKGYYEFLEDVSTQMTEGRSFDPAFSTVEYPRDCRYLRVFTDIDKFGRLLMFGWKARKPYLLSLNDFLPPSSVLRVEKKVPDTDDLGLIRLALGNLARVFSVILGESLRLLRESPTCTER
jgi:hypothetical protein